MNRSAILLMSLGEDEAAEVFKHLEPKEVQKLGGAIAKLRNVSRDEVAEVLESFNAEASAMSPLNMDGDAYLRNVLPRSLGPDKAGMLLDRILQKGEVTGIASLKWMDARAVAELIMHEHPQIIATILVHMDRDQGAEVIGLLDESLRNDVVLRVATLDSVQPIALRELNESLSNVLAGAERIKKASLGGTKVAAELLNYVDNAKETAIMESVRQHDPELAQKILDEMFVFENLLELDDRSIQLLLREVQSESLVLALKGTTEDLRDKVFSNMSQRAAEMLRDDLDTKGPVKLSEVESEQKEILKVVRRLVEEGQISMGGAGGDAYV